MGRWRITRYDPDGNIERVVKLPVPNPTSCVFGGPDLKDLYVTTAWLGSATPSAVPRRSQATCLWFTRISRDCQSPSLLGRGGSGKQVDKGILLLALSTYLLVYPTRQRAGVRRGELSVTRRPGIEQGMVEGVH